MAAAIIDALVVGVITLIGYAAIAGLTFMVSPRTFSFPQASWLLSLAGMLAVAVIYLTVAWAMSGRTYGNLVMGLRVVGRGARPLGALRALARAVACTLLPIGLLWSAVNADKLSLQDLLLRTFVVYDWQPRG
jgi:uncharacterized RDD family membrane protein YckC